MDMPTIDLPLADRIRILKDSDGWFGRAPGEFQDAILSRCEWRTARTGVPIFRAVDERVDLVGVVQGSVEIYTGLRHRRRSRQELADAPVTQGELAEMTNVSRTTLLEILRRLEDKGIIEQRYRYIRVLDPAALDQIAHGS
jgi:CRP-like cAMP-binding protein